MCARGREERRWWIAAGAALAAIYLSLYSVQFLLDWLRERNLLRKSMVGAALLAVAAVGLSLVRRRAGWREWAVVGAAVVAYLLVASRYGVVQERIHLLEYGGVALLFRGALAARAAAVRPVRPPLYVLGGAAALTALAGWLDEAIQWALPNRYYDLRDVGLNALAGAMALATGAALERARLRPRTEPAT